MAVRSLKLRGKHRRLAAVIGGLLLLFGQLLGAAHSHRNQFATGLSATHQVTPNDSGPCPICLSTLHAPVAVASAQLLVRPHAVIEGAVEQRTRPYSSPALASPHGRAPPASV
jgi:transposase